MNAISFLDVWPTGALYWIDGFVIKKHAKVIIVNDFA